MANAAPHYLPLFFRRSTSLLETFPASISASMHACGSDLLSRLMQLRRALLSSPYSRNICHTPPHNASSPLR